MIQKFLFLIICTFAFQAKASLWQSKNSWNEDWEKKFSVWVSTEVSSTFFKDNLISTDCADAAISLRWIFARENLLPAASTVGSGKLVTNLSSGWDSASTSSDWKTDQRFKKALVDIINSTSSRTLFQDTYPVALNSKYLVPGTLFINATKDSGHVEWISKMAFDGMQAPIMFNSSTVPQMVRDLLVYPFMTVKWPQKNQNGFAKFRWALESGGSVKLQSANNMPGYSQEQYQLNSSVKMNFDDFVASRLIGHPIDGLNKIQILASHLIDRYENRVPVVIEGFKVCGGGKCAKESSKFYDHSTYSRDGAIVFLIQGIFDLLYADHNLNVDDQMAGVMTLKWSQIQTDITIDVNGKSHQLGELVSIWNQALFSSDPNDSVQKRWGLQ